MDEEKSYILEWNIENFSHWNSEIHDKKITSSWLNTNPKYTVELYPRGLSGKEEQLEVRLCSSDPSIFSGEVSIIGSDGSNLCTLEVKSKHRLKAIFLDSGPSFDKVVDEIRENAVRYKDRITVKYRFKSKFNNVEDYMCTTIDVLDISLKVTSEVLLSSSSGVVAWVYYPINETEMRNFSLEFKRNEPDDSEILLTLRPLTFEKNISIFTRMTLLNDEHELVDEENEHIFRDGTAWTFSDELMIEDIEENKYCLILHIKIIPSSKYRHSVRAYSTQGGGVTMIPLNRLTDPETYEESCNKWPETLNPSNDSAAMLATELMCLYQDQDFSDFQLKCGAVSFQVHRSILSARSPVFKTMLSTDMKEAASNEMNIEDMDAPTLSRFLAFLYTGKVDDLEGQKALKLYYAADKYQVPTLKSECANFLSDSVSVSNVCDVLSLADRHRDDELLEVVHEFFLENFNQVLGSDEWKSFMTSEPLLAVKTVTKFRDQIIVSRS